MHLIPPKRLRIVVGVIAIFVTMATLWLVLDRYKIFKIPENVKIQSTKNYLLKRFLNTLGRPYNEVFVHLSNAEGKLQAATDV